jgi:hypothetical protein
LFQDRNIGVGIFPKTERVLIGVSGCGGITIASIGASAS